MMRKLLTGTALSLVLCTVSANAQMAVIDVASVAQQIKSVANEATMISNQITQIANLEQTVSAIAHGNVYALGSLMSQLNSTGMTMPLGPDTANLMQSLQGLQQIGQAASNTALIAKGLANTPGQFYAPTTGDVAAVLMNTVASQLANQRSVAQVSLQNVQQRLQQLQTLRQQLSTPGDMKSSQDATGRLVGEGVMLQAQANQLQAVSMVTAAQKEMNEASEAQRWRCWSEVLYDDTASVQAQAESGQIVLVSTASSQAKSAQCISAAGSQPQVNTAGASSDGTAGTFGSGGVTNASLTTTGIDDGSTLSRMTSQAWGSQAASNAQALGVNPTALAATCVLESGCSANVGGTGSISGAFQMSDGTYAETVAAVQASNPALAAQISGKNDPASQSIASAQYLLQGAQSLQGSGISNPTVLDVRSYYQFGPSNAASVANAPDNQLMVNVLSGLPASAYPANNISSTTTVGQWRATVTNKIGGAASQPVLLGSA